jgi:hypothetical protein
MSRLERQCPFFPFQRVAAWFMQPHYCTYWTVLYTEETYSTVTHIHSYMHSPFCAGYKEESSVDICMEYDKTDCRRY